MPEKINIDLGVTKTHFPPPSLDDVIDVINRKRIPQIQKDKLIKKARSTPSSGLSSFLRTVK